MKKILTVRKLLTAASALELLTGLALIAAPDFVIKLLLGENPAGIGLVLSRLFGIALVGLALACWPSRLDHSRRPSAWRAMLVYNALVAAYLAFLGAGGYFVGPLLWPAVAFHAVVTLLLGWLPYSTPASAMND
jgi:hypothetical protein